MSAADSLDRDLSEFPSQVSPPMAPVDPSAVSSDESWQTVDCPGSISVDAIPSAGAEGTPEGTGELERLKQENLELRDRAAQLEQDFTQGQIEWQLETARLLHQVSESTPPEQAQAVQAQLTTAQEQLTRLFQELELSFQTAQRQQILVETLTEQLTSGQERIAELERDCATTQQRYNEQVQQRLQAEASCRDLRIRLNRQQQHTLQFKVALEKCLEMPAPSSRAAEVDLSNVLAAPFEPLTAEAIVANQNSPVQPWSAPVNQLNLRPPLSHLLQDNLQSPLQSPGQTHSLHQVDSQSLQEPAPQNPEELLNLIFPGSEPPVTAGASEAKAFFDLQPLLETDEAPIAPDSNQIQPASDALWQDLPNLGDSPSFPSETQESAGPEDVASAAIDLNQTLQALELGLEEEPKNSAPFTHVPLFSGSPSPVVYPLRPSKKRDSLAAVELPTFPRKRQ